MILTGYSFGAYIVGLVVYLAAILYIYPNAVTAEKLFFAISYSISFWVIRYLFVRFLYPRLMK